LPHHSSASRFTVGGAEQCDEREHIQPQQEARYEADVWEDKIHDIQMPPIARGALARRRASHVRMSLTQLIFGLLLGIMLPIPGLTAFDESGVLFPIID
jgi:hypothetical protein